MASSSISAHSHRRHSNRCPTHQRRSEMNKTSSFASKYHGQQIEHTDTTRAQHQHDEPRTKLTTHRCVKREPEVWRQRNSARGNRRFTQIEAQHEMGRPVVGQKRRSLCLDAVITSAAARGKFKYAAKPVRRQDDLSHKVATDRCVERVARGLFTSLAIADKKTTILTTTAHAAVDITRAR
ncbi:hypothetical protein D9611_011391 [Ephemerocybe angulata]|uniref:Uncharacterized protein n=1 Tax=Ephemerocybe angulata TaxID=980116 RepID=A0A8H5F1J0_9AGAR|nr:hypothetical protein D9611_011391 [Tulosesus angulatus]